VEQAVLNLVVNARDALPGGGRIAVATREALVAPSVATAERRAGRYVVASVEDTGRGMDAATLAHAFEPFFRAGGDGTGSGLSLSTVYGIARQHGGFVEAESREGRGSAFSIFFPAAKAETGVPAPEDASPLPRGTETVLLAEDDAAVREPTAALLERLGYRVHAAADGIAALALADRVGEIDLLVTDLVLPHMGGRDLARALASRRPEVRVLFLSGYGPADSAPIEAGGAELPFLAKPWTPAALARKLREVLERPWPGPLAG